MKRAGRMNSRLKSSVGHSKSSFEIADQVMEGLDQEECLTAATELESIAGIIRTRINSTNQGQTLPPIPKGFVLVNLSAREQAELRQFSRECGVTFRNGLRHALLNLRSMLKEWAQIKSQTGLSVDEQSRLLTANTKN